MTDGAAKPEILIIDDEVQIRRLLRLTLESAGYRVRDAATGQPKRVGWVATSSADTSLRHHPA